MRGDSSEIFSQSFLREALVSSPLCVVVHPVFALPTTAAPTLQGVLKDGFGETVVALVSVS